MTTAHNVRKITQITAMSPAIDNDDFFGGAVVALCDDGTVWTMSPSTHGFGIAWEGQWQQLPPIPQEEGKPHD